MDSAISRIEHRLDQLGIKRSTMLQDLSIPSSSYSTWKKKNAYPDSKYMASIAKYIGTSIDYIYNGDCGTLERVQLENEPCVIKVLGRVAAGVPIEASEDVIGEEMITQKMAESGEYFGLRISGNSMEPEIHHGSIVIVRQQDDVENGDIAIVLINGGEATCKKIEKFDNGIMLVPFNKEYPEKFYTNEEIENLPVRILGKVVEQRKKY